MIQREVVEVRDIWIYKENGFFLGESKDGRKIMGVSHIPPVGTFTAAVTVERDKKGDGNIYRCNDIKYESEDALTYSILASGLVAGIKEGKADNVFKTFGNKIWDILSNAADNVQLMDWNGKERNPVDLLQDANGVGPKVARQMIDGWKENRTLYELAKDAMRISMPAHQFRKFFLKRSSEARNSNEPHLTPEMFSKMLRSIGQYSVYDLLDFGMKWEKLDEIAFMTWPGKEALPKDSVKRYRGAVKYAFMGDFEGHMCLPITQVNKTVESLIGVKDVIGQLKPEESGFVIFKDFIYPTRNYVIETMVASRLKNLIYARGERPIIMNDEAIRSYADVDLEEHQVQAIRVALRSKVSCITGGPGTGKTTITKIICDILEDNNVPFFLAAFMGAAARRLGQATGRDAKTLHRTFNIGPNGYARGEGIDEGYLIIDEASTIPMDLLHGILSLVGDGVHIVFIGDADQLPPVGLGEPFIQILETENVPSVRLKKIHRNGGAIAQACFDVNNGILPKATKGDDDFFLITNCENMPQRIMNAEDYFVSKGWTDAQIITPLNGTSSGRHELNKIFRNKRNPNGVKVPGFEISTGDRVVQSKNNYEINVFNGMIGVCKNLTEVGEQLAKDEDVEVDDVTPIAEVVFDDTITKYYSSVDLVHLQLGYAITAHKSQGSQYPYVIVALPNGLGPLAARQIVYTAMSRAQKKLAVIAAPGVLERCIKNEEKVRRYSNLSYFIKESVLAFEEDMP